MAAGLVFLPRIMTGKTCFDEILYHLKVFYNNSLQKILILFQHNFLFSGVSTSVEIVSMLDQHPDFPTNIGIQKHGTKNTPGMWLRKIM